MAWERVSLSWDDLSGLSLLDILGEEGRGCLSVCLFVCQRGGRTGVQLKDTKPPAKQTMDQLDRVLTPQLKLLCVSSPKWGLHQLSKGVRCILVVLDCLKIHSRLLSYHHKISSPLVLKDR